MQCRAQLRRLTFIVLIDSEGANEVAEKYWEIRSQLTVSILHKSAQYNTHTHTTNNVVKYWTDS